MKLEDRVLALETKLAAWEARRSRILTAELEAELGGEELQTHLARSAKFAVARIREAQAKNSFNAHFQEAKMRLAAKIEEAKQLREQEELAELAAVAEHYERTGEVPPGYNLIGDETEQGRIQ
jgi:predicted ATPase with chaperone activity